jgi:hypothetical protein
MKKNIKNFIIILIISILYNTTIKAQHSVEQIEDALIKIGQLADSLYGEELFDTAYFRMCAHVSECDVRIGASGSTAWRAERAIWHAEIGELLSDYYNTNMPTIGRSTTDDDTPAASGAGDHMLQRPSRWDEERFQTEIERHFTLALEDALASRAGLSEYACLYEEPLFPTGMTLLYDFIADRYRMALPSTCSRNRQDSFKIKEEVVLADDFFTRPLPSDDTLGYGYRMMRLLQQRMSVHRADADRSPQLYVQLLRLQLCGDSDRKAAAMMREYDHYRGVDGCGILAEWIGNFYSGREEGRNALHWYEIAAQNAKDEKTERRIRDIIELIKAPQYGCDGKGIIYPEPQLFRITSRNCDSIFVYTVKKGKRVPQIVSQQIIQIPTTHDYRNDTTFFIYNPPAPGAYHLILSDTAISRMDDNESLDDYEVLYVSRYRFIYQCTPESLEVWVTDGKSGEPVSGVKLELVEDDSFYSSDSKSNTMIKRQSAADGHAIFPWRDKFLYARLNVYDKNGKVCLSKYIPYFFYDHNNWKKSGHIFTDRKIYRPGQTIHWKVLLIDEDNRHSRLAPNQQIVVRLEDANYEIVKDDTVTVNEFGTATGTFDLPKSGLPGTYEITVICDNYGSRLDISVEEYKRPTFAVELPQPTESYRSGETVSVAGTATAYAGYPVQGAKVSYSIERTRTFPYHYHHWWRNPWIDDIYYPEIIAHGECTTDEEGRFRFTFDALSEEQVAAYFPLYCYKVSVTVTDRGGESHDGTLRIYVSDRAWQFDLDLPMWVRADGDVALPLRILNLSGEPQQGQVTYSVVRLDMPDRFLLPYPFDKGTIPDGLARQFPQYAFHQQNEAGNWTEGATIESGRMTTGDSSQLVLTRLALAPAGAYKLLVSTTDPYGQPINEEHFFFHSSPQDKSFVPYQALYVQATQPRARLGEEVSFTVGTYIDHAHVRVQLYANDSLCEERWLTFNRRSPLQTVAIKAPKRGEVSCRAFIDYEGESFTQSASTLIPFDNKEIQIEFSTFRDVFAPGERASFKVRLGDEFKRPLTQAELLCTMYDASLDAFAANHFKVWLSETNYHTAPDAFSLGQNLHYYHSFGIISLNRRSFLQSPQWKHPDPSFTWMLQLMDYDVVPVLCTYVRNDNAVVHIDRDISPGRPTSKMGSSPTELYSNAETTAAADENGFTDLGITPRSNFAETAFFYPFLRTNETGEIEIEFTLPESLTEWRMLGFAHTKDLRTGLFEKTLHAKKTLMVVPNAPRFVYENDRFDFTAKVVNTGNTAMDGQAELRLFNAETGEELKVEQRPVSVAANGTETVAFEVEVPSGIPALTCRITARANNGSITYSDGEEHTLPVLSRRQIVTESIPLFITHKGSRQFSSARLRKNQHSLISCRLLFTPDPKWNVVLALPHLTQYPYECNEQLFSKLYAYTISMDIAKQNPGIEGLLNDCAARHPEALQSKLRQNEELAQVLLSETPWLMEAQDEEQEIQDLFCLFDRQRAQDEITLLVRKLANGQNDDGGWPWFSGGKSSRYITEHLLIGAGRLIRNNIATPGYNFLGEEAINRAVAFIAREQEESYQEMKKRTPEAIQEYQLTSGDLHYLYARSMFPDTEPKREGYTFLETKLREQANELPTFYQKTLAALTLYQIGTLPDRALAKQIMEEIKARAMHSEELGMYWKKEGYGFYWDESMIERQSLMIEAFSQILNDEASVKEMKVWLLQQRRAQHWASTRATADACHALLCGNDDAAAPADIALTLCGETHHYADTLQIPVSQNVSECLNGNTSDVITLSRSNDGLAYGGVVYRYYADIDDIEGGGKSAPLSVERKLYRVSNDDGGERLTSVTDDQPLRVGDKVRVRLTIRCDRDLEFIHLKDLRAAAFEPTETISGYRWQRGLGYYQAFHDASVSFFFDRINRGTYVFEYTLSVAQIGRFSSGYASIECMYAPEFNAHSATNGKINVIK